MIFKLHSSNTNLSNKDAKLRLRRVTFSGTYTLPRNAKKHNYSKIITLVIEAKWREKKGRRDARGNITEI